MILCVSGAVAESSLSSLSYHISLALAQFGLGVLLVDADPAAPLSEIGDLSESGVVLDRGGSMVMRSLPARGPSVLCGFGRALASDPEKTIDHLKHLKNDFDVIVVDMPATVSAASPSLLLSQADRLVIGAQFEADCMPSLTALLEACTIERRRSGRLTLHAVLPLATSSSRESAEGAATRAHLVAALPEAFAAGGDLVRLPSSLTLQPLPTGESPYRDRLARLAVSLRDVATSSEDHPISSFYSDAAETILESDVRNPQLVLEPLSRTDFQPSPVSKPKNVFQQLLNWVSNMLRT